MGGPRKKHTAAELAAKGRCSGCARKLAEGCTHKTCERCRTTKAKSARVAYKASRRKHQCIDCHRRPRVQGRVRCTGCGKRAREKHRVRDEALKGLGMCLSRCGAKATKGGRCDGCRAKRKQQDAARDRNATRERREAAGLCIDCEAPWISDQFTRCSDCREANSAKCKQRAADRIAAGVCRGCGKLPPVAGSTNCRKCRARRRARDRSE